MKPVAGIRRLCLPLAAAVLAGAGAPAALPGIEITTVPPIGSANWLAGRVLNAAPAEHRVALFIFVPNAGWYTKPTCAQALTTIQPDGSWTASIVSHPNDVNATRITALLVSSNYHEPCVDWGPAALPSNVLAQALASATVERDDPNAPRVSFSGYDWTAKASSGQVGPGPNYFSSSTSNVWVDALGRLHLRITHRAGQWQCAEVLCRRSLGHGYYRFQLDSPVDTLNPNVVLGLFTWSDDAAHAHREIDFEFARWGAALDTNNAQYVVQPFDLPGHMVRYRVPPPLSNSTYQFKWETNQVTFWSFTGYSTHVTNQFNHWTYTGPTPPAGDEVVHLNLWLMGGSPPTDGNEAEVIIRRFEFQPLGPRFSSWGRTNGQLRLVLEDGLDRDFDILISTNLPDWTRATTVPLANGVLEYCDTNTSAAGQRFYRAASAP